MVGKLKTALIILLFLGIYVDIKLQPKDNAYCFHKDNKGYNQRALIIQTVIPFNPQRYTFLFGVGNKHWEVTKNIRIIESKETGKIIDTDIDFYGCSVEEYGFDYNSYYYRYIDLRPFSEIIGVGQVKVNEDKTVINKETYKRWYGKL